jgi:hypothetical protein
MWIKCKSIEPFGFLTYWKGGFLLATVLIGALLTTIFSVSVSVDVAPCVFFWRTNGDSSVDLDASFRWISPGS